MDRGYTYYGEGRLGHSFISILLDWLIGHTMLDKWPHLSPWDLLSLGTFCPLLRCVFGLFVCTSFVMVIGQLQMIGLLQCRGLRIRIRLGIRTKL